MSWTLGDWQLDIACGGDFKLDGGAMFGIIPKPLWEKVAPADERNRIEMTTNCLVARDGRQTLIFDTGYGGKCTARQAEQMQLDPGEPLPRSLAELGLEPADITGVVLSHLHFDHAGGGTRFSGAGQLVPTFPKATYYVGRLEWETATANRPELRGAYPPENLLPLAEANCLELVDPGDEPLPGLRMNSTPGHTQGHLSPMLTSQGQTVIFLGDLCPLTTHLRTLWCMAYDTHPLETRVNKPGVLGRAADEGWLVAWDHDPRTAIGRLARREAGEFEVLEA